MIKIKLDKLILNHIHILALILLILISIFSTNYYSSYKKNQIEALENITENIYLKKTTNLFINSLKPRFETINSMNKIYIMLKCVRQILVTLAVHTSLLKFLHIK